MSQMIELGVPEDGELLKALGRLAVAHGNLEMTQIMCLKTLYHMRPHEALEQYRRKGATRIRELIEQRVRELAEKSENVLVTRVVEVILDVRYHSKRRNALIHRFWGHTQDGDWKSSGDESNWEGLPSIDVINDLVRSILKTTQELNRERFKGGFLAILAERVSATRVPNERT
jgi:hypothetical protein